MTSGIPGSSYQPSPDTAARLATWHRLAALRWPVDDIARHLGIDRRTLDRAVCRARKHGHPDAILHPEARRAGSGTWHLTGRAPRNRRRAQEHR